MLLFAPAASSVTVRFGAGVTLNMNGIVAGLT